MQAHRDLEDYFHTKHYKDGLNRCNRLIKKSNKDPLVQLFKARFLRALGQQTEAEAVIKYLADPAVRLPDSSVIEDIDTFLWECRRDDKYPASISNGTESNALWANLASSSPRNFHPSLHKDRYTHAIQQQRWGDANLALTNWRRTEPNRKDLRFAHVAIYQLISESAKDQMTIRMNTQLADRTMMQQTTENITTAELKLMIDIVRRQKSYPRLSGFFRTFQHVIEQDPLIVARLVDALREAGDWDQLLDITTSLLIPVSENYTASQGKVDTGADDWRIWQAFLLATEHTDAGKRAETLTGHLAEESRIALLAVLWRTMRLQKWDELIVSALAYFAIHRTYGFCYSELREYLLVLPDEQQTGFRLELSKASKKMFETISPEAPNDQIMTWLRTEANALRFEYLLTIGQALQPSVDFIYAFVQNAVRLQTFTYTHDSEASHDFMEFIVFALWQAYMVDRDLNHLLLAATLTCYFVWNGSSQLAFLAYLNAELGFYSRSLYFYDDLNLKEIQMDTASHVGLTRLSINYPAGFIPRVEQRSLQSRELLKSALDMYNPTIARIADQQCLLLDCSRFDLLLELEDLRKSLEHSVNRRQLILELRRSDRLIDRDPDTTYIIHPAVIEAWTEDLRDSRDFGITEFVNVGDRQLDSDRKFQGGGAVPDADWIRYHVWIDEICSLATGGSLLSKPFLDADAATGPIQGSSSFTKEEKAMVTHWKALYYASVLALAPEQAVSLMDARKDLTGALEELHTTVARLRVKDMISLSRGSQQIPSSATIQSILLQMDFLKAVERFVARARVNVKDKSQKQKLDHIRDVSSMYFNNLRKYVVDRRNLLDTKMIAATIEQLLERLMGSPKKDTRPTGDAQSEITAKLNHLKLWQDAESFTKLEQIVPIAANFAGSAKLTWDGILQIRFSE
ncbi:hypothetical protein ANO11243_072580 [Dothideomycetidae sp. 11243]|nr:hypothetical protein ANO11243_072580 [fungal sp. No.11243]